MALSVVKSIESNTALTLASPWNGSSLVASAYALNVIDRTIVTAPLASGYASSTTVAVVANRLLIAIENAVYFSYVGDPGTFGATDYHGFPSKVTAIDELRDAAAVFTATGVYTISNMAYDLTDASGNPQQRVELVNSDMVAWTHEGIASWKGSLIVPALDGVWLMDGVSAPVRISNRIADLYLGYVRTSGFKTGVAEVFNGHYLLPILNSSNVWQDTLVCRLEATHQGPAFSWSQLGGFGTKVTAFAERSSSPPVLLGASTQASSRVLDCTSYFSPTASVKNDADGTTHTWQLVTRNIPLGDRPTAALSLTANYSLVDAASDNPTITAEVSVDGGSYTLLTVTTGTDGGTTAGEQDGSQTVYWQVSKAGRFIRFRFTCSNPAASLQFKRMELRYRPRGN